MTYISKHFKIIKTERRDTRAIFVLPGYNTITGRLSLSCWAILKKAES